LEIRYFKKLITFSIHRESNVINLSRIAFEDLKMAKSHPRSTSQMVYIDGQKQPALCVCFATVDDDLTQTASQGQYPTKSLNAIMLQQEYELKVANLCILLDVPVIHSQIDDNVWSFTTRFGGSSDQAGLDQSSLSFQG
jgi:hypothetical protein